MEQDYEDRLRSARAEILKFENENQLMEDRLRSARAEILRLEKTNELMQKDYQAKSRSTKTELESLKEELRGSLAKNEKAKQNFEEQRKRLLDTEKRLGELKNLVKQTAQRAEEI